MDGDELDWRRFDRNVKDQIPVRALRGSENCAFRSESVSFLRVRSSSFEGNGKNFGSFFGSFSVFSSFFG